MQWISEISDIWENNEFILALEQKSIMRFWAIHDIVSQFYDLTMKQLYRYVFAINSYIIAWSQSELNKDYLSTKNLQTQDQTGF